jgi:hypothetical protein
MSARHWLSPRMRRAVVSLSEELTANRVAFVFEDRLVEIVGKNATNVIKGLVGRRLLVKVKVIDATDTFAFSLSRAGQEQAARLRHALERHDRRRAS